MPDLNIYPATKTCELVTPTYPLYEMHVTPAMAPATQDVCELTVSTVQRYMSPAISDDVCFFYMCRPSSSVLEMSPEIHSDVV